MKPFYRSSDCIILLYDVNDRGSFDNCQNYYKEKIELYCKNNIKVIMLANKRESEGVPVIPYEEALNFASINNYNFMEICISKNQNIFEAFNKIINIGLKVKREEENEKKSFLIKRKKNFSKKYPC